MKGELVQFEETEYVEKTDSLLLTNLCMQLQYSKLISLSCSFLSCTKT